MKILGSKKIKGHKQESQSGLRSPVEPKSAEGGVPYTLFRKGKFQ